MRGSQGMREKRREYTSHMLFLKARFLNPVFEYEIESGHDP
jgi:hypothetical protein